ncbi:unnamed protein product [Meloidogyne enterolobii]|uniref:Uncharacterized protein n=1 Tax=Meloidogyne enterolobii TaxID=390850 RepID=A0ACB1AZV6_MELEN
MYSNVGNFTPEDLASDTSLISTEDEFVCVIRPKMKEIGTMTDKMDIPKVEQNEVHFNYRQFASDLIVFSKIIYELIKVLFDKAKIGAVIAMDWIFNHSSFVLSCFMLINGIALFYFNCFPNFNSLPEFNKATIASIHNKLNLFFMILLFLLVFLLIGYLLWQNISIIIFNDRLSGKAFFVLVVLICYVVTFWIYFDVLNSVLMNYFKKNEEMKNEKEKFFRNRVCYNGGSDCHYV